MLCDKAYLTDTYCTEAKVIISCLQAGPENQKSAISVLKITLF